MTRTAYPSDSATWNDAIALVPSDAPKSDETCNCGENARVFGKRVTSFVRGDREVGPYSIEVFECVNCASDSLDVSNIWTGTEWDAWENVIDFPSDYFAA